MTDIEFDTSTALGQHAERERALADHASGRGPQPCLTPNDCAFVRERNRAYRAYTGKFHPSLLVGGSDG